MRRLLHAAFRAGLLLGLSCTWAATVPSVAQTTPYTDPTRPIDERVEDLLSRMTLAEKVGQMDQIDVTQVTDRTGNCTSQNGFAQPNDTCEQKVLIDNNVGSLLAGGSDLPPGNTGKSWADAYNTLQQFAVQHSRLHIPLLFGVDALHGFNHPFQATLFPHQIGLGATWDPAIAQLAGATTQQQLVATGWTWDFSPVQDLARDTRWGRYYETWAEEPALASAMGSAYVTALQGSGNNLAVAATVKHYAGYSQSVNGHDRVPAEFGIRYLQDILLPAYAGGIDAGAAAVMVDSGAVDGIPAHASKFLLTEELRNRQGFKGVVISDFGDVPALANTYHVAPDLARAVALAVNAGVDEVMLPYNSDQFQTVMLQDVQSGAIAESRVDEAVRRILRLKFALGLFEHQSVDASAADAAVAGGLDAARKAADESMTLLRNEGSVLPLAKDAKIVVTGPSADSVANQLGGWSVAWQGVFVQGNHTCCMGPPNQIPPATTVVAGLQQLAADPQDVVFAADQASAVSAAASADAVVAVVGERPYAEGLGDNSDPVLDPDQQALIAALQQTGRPVITVIIAGRPLGLGPAAQSNALLMAYLPGTQGGLAVADVLYGDVNPSGRLPVTWPSAGPAMGADFQVADPSTPGDQPKVFDQPPGTNYGPGSGYNARFPFASGLSYTSFSVADLGVSPPADSVINLTFTVTNTGQRAGADVVPVYVQQPVSATLVPPRRLVGFARVELQPGAAQVVQVAFPTSTLAVTPGDVDSSEMPRVEPGAYQVQVESMTAGVSIP